MLLPRMVGDSFEITSISTDGAPKVVDAGISLTMSSRRLKRLLREVLSRSSLLPPGVIRHGTTVEGAWVPIDMALPNGGRLPLRVSVDDMAGERPVLLCRYPADAFNELVKSELSDRLTTDEDWVFGSYELSYDLDFDTFRLISKDEDLALPIQSRRFEFEATGRARVKFRDDFLKIRSTGKVKSLHGWAEFEVVRLEDGVGLQYRADISRLDADFHNVAGYLDDKICDKLASSMRRSLNKEKKRVKFARKRFPEWVPWDLTFDFRLTEAPPESQ